MVRRTLIVALVAAPCFLSSSLLGAENPHSRLTVTELTEACRGRTKLCFVALELYVKGFSFGALIFGYGQNLEGNDMSLIINRCIMMINRKFYDDLAKEYANFVEQNSDEDILTSLTGFMEHCRKH